MCRLNITASHVKSLQKCCKVHRVWLGIKSNGSNKIYNDAKKCKTMYKNSHDLYTSCYYIRRLYTI